MRPDLNCQSKQQEQKYNSIQCCWTIQVMSNLLHGTPVLAAKHFEAMK